MKRTRALLRLLGTVAAIFLFSWVCGGFLGLHQRSAARPSSWDTCRSTVQARDGSDQHHGEAPCCPAKAQRLTPEQLYHTAQGAHGFIKPHLFGRDTRLHPIPHWHHWWNEYCAFDTNVTFDMANFESDSILRETAKRGPAYWDTCPLALQQQLLSQLYEAEQYELLNLTPCDLWPYLAGRTLWLFGDSQMRDFFRFFECFTLDWHTTAVHDPFDSTLLTHQDLQFLQGLSHECLDLAPHTPTPRPTRLCIVRINTAQQALAMLKHSAHAGVTRDDVAVFNFGLWYHDAWEYTKGLHMFTRYLRLHAPQLPLVYWMETPAQHFDNRFGEWPAQYKPPFTCAPLKGVALGGDGGLHGTEDADMDTHMMLAGGWRNQLANDYIRRASVPVIHTFNWTATLWEYHRDSGAGYECTHYCQPSAHVFWTYQLFVALRQCYGGRHAPTTGCGYK